MRIKGYPLLALTLAILFLGGWSSFSLFRFMAQNIHEPIKPKDTVYVKLLDGLPFRTDTTVTHDSVKRSSPNPLPLTNTAGVTPNGTVRDTNYLARPQMTLMIEDSITKATAAARLSAASFSWWAVGIVVLLIMCITLLLLYNRLPHLSEDLQKDLDPAELTSLFQKFGNQIEEIGNPRKIKRLSNKIRFQYNYITSRGFTDPASREALVSILLDLERKPWTKPVYPPPEDPNNTPDELFYRKYDKHRPSNPAFSDGNLMRLIYTLNRDRI